MVLVRPFLTVVWKVPNVDLSAGLFITWQLDFCRVSDPRKHKLQMEAEIFYSLILEVIPSFLPHATCERELHKGVNKTRQGSWGLSWYSVLADGTSKKVTHDTPRSGPWKTLPVILHVLSLPHSSSK